MESTIEQGYLVLADISGFTPFVADSELAHSQEILSEILKLIIRNFTPTLTLAEVEGDAVFAYAPHQKLRRGETLLEIIEATYLAFRDKRESSRRMATCRCKACQMIPMLDLKFVTHYGDFVLQNVAGTKKPLGSCVNLAHRLLKNSVSKATGWRGYALFSEQSLEKMDIYPNNMHTQVESYEHLGDSRTHSVNLDDRYKELTEERHVFLKPEESDVVVTCDFSVPPPVLWEWLNDAQKRTLWMAGSAWHEKERPQGRTSRGASNHCSNTDFLERVLDWRPFTYYTVDLIKSPIRMTMTSQLEPIADGIRLSCHMRLNGSLPRWILRPLCKLIVAKRMKMKQCLELLARLTQEGKTTREIVA